MEDRKIRVFYNDFKWNFQTVTTCILMHLTGLALIRLVVGYLFISLGVAVLPSLFRRGVPLKDKNGLSLPLPRSVVKYIHPIMVFASRGILFCMGFIVLPAGGKLSPETRAIVSNHCTVWDALFILASGIEASPFPAAGLLQSSAILRSAANSTSAFWVERQQNAGKHTAAAEMKRRVKDPSFPRFLVFPEGTTVNTKKGLISFKNGVFRTGTPVQPVVIKFSNANCAWVIGTGLRFNFWLTTWQLPTKVEVKILDPVPSTLVGDVFDITAVEAQADACRRAMAAELGVPMTDHTYEDHNLLDTSLKLFGETIEIPLWSRLKDEFPHINYVPVKEALKTFFLEDRENGNVNDDGEWQLFEYFKGHPQLLPSKAAPDVATK